MNPANSMLRTWSAPAVALVLILAFYSLARFPTVPVAETEALAARFRFTRQPLPELAGHPPHKLVREVHPSLSRISAWISSLGAAITITDLDGDGLANDLIWVDPRTDLVTVLPAPGTGARYEPFALEAAPLPFDRATMAPMGSLAGDFNEDGLMDVLVYYWGRAPVLFLHAETQEASRLARGAFAVQGLVSGEERWFSNGATQADFDGDGHVDLVIGNYFQDGSRILDAKADGIEVLHEGKSKALNGGLKHLFLWAGALGGERPQVNFRRVTGSLSEEVNRGWTLAVGAADLDGDLLPEIYFGFDFGPDRLLHNRSQPGQLGFAELRGERGFFTPKSCVIGADSFKGMGCDFGDVNGDGLLDIYVSNIATKFGLTESHFLWESTGEVGRMREGYAPYRHASERLGLSRSGWGWESRLDDFDNDGVLEAIQACGFIKGQVNRWPELQALGTSNDQVVHNPRFWPNFKPGADLSGHDWNPFFVRGKDGRFHDVAPALGLAEPRVSKGIATADVDGDGRLDFATANQWEPSFFFQNRSPEVGRFLTLRLLLPTARTRDRSLVVRAGHATQDWRARPAIGATVRATLPSGRVLVSQVDGGAGHSGRRSAEVHLGLGAVAEAASVPVEIRWRDTTGQPQRLELELSPGRHSILLGESGTRSLVARIEEPHP